MKNELSLTSRTGKAKIRFLTFAGLLALAPIADACKGNIAQSTIYYVPHVRDLCKSNKPCSKFNQEVKLQGSGTLASGKSLKYTGKTIDIGDCETARGAAGRCLIPYMSVAADPRHFRMGDVIELPAMRGKKIKMPNGKTIKHPGYFIVMDTGGAIKGANRFDFFTGSHGANHPDNAFGYKGDTEVTMYQKNTCVARKQFKIHRLGSAGYKTAISKIEHVYDEPVETPSTGTASKGAR